MASFGTTISSGIQDISAILSLFGTEQCEMHVGSALRGGGRGGYLYAAVTPLSIFGSLGAAKAAFTIMFISLPFGARTLKYVGFEPKGDVVAATMLESDSDRYLAETRLLQILKKHYIRSARGVSVKRPPVTLRLIHPWDFSLLLASLLVAGLGVLPYLHFSVLHHTPFPGLAIIFPICRVFGGLLCVFPGQLLLQYRIQMIMKQRLLFEGINHILNEKKIKVPVQHLLWDDTNSSETCLSSLIDFLNRKPAVTRFVEHIGQVLGLGLDQDPLQDTKEITSRIKPYLTNSWSWFALIYASMLGFFMTIIGYIGCFTIVQSSSAPRDTYIWLSTETTLALLRLLVWGLNPSCDDSDGICLAPTTTPELPAVTKAWVVINRKQFPMLKIVNEARFWQEMTAHSGPVDIDPGSGPGSQRWYSWMKGEGDRLQLICIILEGQETVLCHLNDSQDMKFYHADLNFNPGHVVQKEELAKNHELMKEETNFKLDVLKHFHFVISTKNTAQDPVCSIKASWPLSESSVTSVIANNSTPRPRDAEHGDFEVPARIAWSQIVEIMDKLLAGRELGYKQISICRVFVSETGLSMDLRQRLSDYLSARTEEISKGSPKRDTELKKYYNDNWEIYSKGVIYLDRLFESLPVNHAKVEKKKGVEIEAVVNVALKHWKSHVLETLRTRLRDLTMASEVDRVLSLFSGEDWTRADFWNMKLKSRGDRSALEEASADGRTEIVRLLLEAGLVKGEAKQYDKALQAASSSGHTAIVRLLLEKGAAINSAGIPVLQTASSADQLDVVQILLDSGADVNAVGGDDSTALQAASFEGHTEIVRLLLKSGADINAAGGEYWTVLQAASCKGHESVVRLLLEAGADVKGQLGGKHGDALQAACFEGHTGIVRLLLKSGADINAASEEYWTALEAASFQGHESIVSLLLEAGADVNIVGGRDGSALYGASDRGQPEIVRLLLEKGADANAMGGTYWTALQAASYNGHENVVGILLEAGADVNGALGGEHGGPLEAASFAGHTEIVCLLLKSGAAINAASGEYCTALQAASCKSHESIVGPLLESGIDVTSKYGSALCAASFTGQIGITRLLLEKGADVNATGGAYYTALQAASCNGREDVVGILLEAGADVNGALGGEHGGALQAASFAGHTKIVRLLLKSGAAIDAATREYRTALQAASCKGHESIVGLLLEAGADVNTVGGRDGSALYIASDRGQTEIVRLLLGKGADVNATGGEYGTALQAASSNGHQDIVGFLLEVLAGVDIMMDTVGSKYDSALRSASYKGQTGMVRLFLAHGADINATGGEYWTALQAACCEGHEDTVRLLCEKGAKINTRGGKYGSPLQAASHKGHIGIVRHLVSLGADVNASESGAGLEYSTALDAASGEGHTEIARLLKVWSMVQAHHGVSTSEKNGPREAHKGVTPAKTTQKGPVSF